MYPAEFETKDTTYSITSASYLDLLVSIGRDGQLHTSFYDKRDDFNVHITKFPFLSSNIPSSTAKRVFISQLIQYSRACYSYERFILIATRLSFKLIGRDMSKNVWYRPSGCSMVDIGISSNIMKSPLPNVIWNSGTWSYMYTAKLDFDTIDKTFH